MGTLAVRLWQPPVRKPIQRVPQQVVGDLLVQGPSSEPPKPKRHWRTTTAQLAQTLPKMSDLALQGVLELILEAQPQLRTTESKADNHTRLASVMGQIKHRKDN